MALKRRNVLRVRVELPHNMQGKQSLEDELRNKLYQAASDALTGLDTDIDIEIEDDNYDLVENFRESWADAMEGRTISREEFRRRMSDNA